MTDENRILVNKGGVTIMVNDVDSHWHPMIEAFLKGLCLTLHQVNKDPRDWSKLARHMIKFCEEQKHSCG